MLGGLSLVAVAIPVALIAQAAATGGDTQLDSTGGATTDLVPSEEHYEVNADASETSSQLIGFESCTVINGLIPADPDVDGTTDVCWALEGAGDRPDECPADDQPYMFADTNDDGIVDACRRAEFRCDNGHPYDSDGDGDVDDCLTLEQWVQSLRPPATPTPKVTATPIPTATSVPTATPVPRVRATAIVPRPTATPRPRPRPTATPRPTREPYWSQPD